MTASVVNQSSSAQQTIAIAQVLQKQGNWVFDGTTLAYQTISLTTETFSNGLTFYCDATITQPVIIAQSELTSQRAITNDYNCGIPILKTYSGILSIGIQNVGFWFQIAQVLASVGVFVTSTLSNTNTVCTPVFSDQACTTTVTSNVNQTLSYRQLPFAFNTVAAAGLTESTTIQTVASNLLGSSVQNTFTFSNIRIDPVSLLPRVIFSAATLYPDVTTATSFDNNQVIKNNSSQTVYNSSQIFYNGFFKGDYFTDWSQNYSIKGYIVPGSYPNYSVVSNTTRYATFKYNLDTSQANAITIKFNTSGNPSMANSTFLAKIVNKVDSTKTTPWLNIFAYPRNTNPTNDGDAGQYAVYSDPYTTSISYPGSSSIDLYIRTALASSSQFAYSGLTVSLI